MTDLHRSRTRFRRQLALACAGLLVLGACSGSDAVDSVEPTADDPPAVSSDAGDPAEDLVVDEPEDQPADQATDGGTCTVTSEGPLAVSFTSGGGVAAVSSDYWLPDDSPGKGQTPALLVSCDSGDGVTLAITRNDPADLPFLPGIFQLEVTDIGLFTPDAILAPATPVQLELFSFDAAGVSGDATFTVIDASGSVSDVSVTFDLANPTPG